MKRHILIVDDNPYVVNILVQTLSQDFTITVADSGQYAARLLVQGNRFDIVLTELELPLFSGLELIKLIRMSRLSSQTPVMVPSNVSDSRTRISCLEQGADSFLSKPFNPLEIKAKIFALLRRADAPNKVRQTPLPIHFEKGSKSFWTQRFRMLATFLGNYAIS
ncbi:response regulator transcription factor [Spirosoma aerophilum]